MGRARRPPGTGRRSCAGSTARLRHVGHLIAARDAADGAPSTASTGPTRQVTVIDIHNLHDRAKRFVVGVVLKRMFEEKERAGTAQPLVFLVLDELNKYAPREGWSPSRRCCSTSPSAAAASASS